MKSALRSLLALSCLFLLCFSASAQNAWSLQQCIDRALDKNIQIRISELNEEQAKAQVDENYASFFPSINGSVGQNYFFGRSIDPYTNSYTTNQVQSNSFSLSGSMPLFEGFQVQNALRQSKLNYLSAQNDLKKIRNDIQLNVVSDFLSVMYNQELYDVTKAQVDASAVQRDKMKRMYELGSVNKGSYLELESQLASDQLRLVQSKAQYDQSVLNLTQLIELDSVKDFAVVRPDVAVPNVDASAFNTDGVYTAALTNQPDIASSEYKVMSAEKSLAIARGSRYPRLSMNGSLSTSYSTSSKQVESFVYGTPSTYFSGFTSTGDSVFTVSPNVTPVYGETPFKKQFNDNLGRSVGFSLSVPVFNGWQTRTGIRRAKISLEQTRLNHESNKKTLFKNVQQAIADAIASQHKYESGQKRVEALTETFNFNQERFDLGLISSYDYLQSKNNLSQAQADLLQAKYEYIMRLKIIDFYLGKPLTF